MEIYGSEKVMFLCSLKEKISHNEDWVEEKQCQLRTTLCHACNPQQWQEHITGGERISAEFCCQSNHPETSGKLSKKKRKEHVFYLIISCIFQGISLRYFSPLKAKLFPAVILKEK